MFESAPPWFYIFLILTIAFIIALIKLKLYLSYSEQVVGLISLAILSFLIYWSSKWIWTYIIQPNFLLILGFLVANVFIGLYLIKRKIRFEEEQISKGLVKIIDRFGHEKWITPEEAEKEKLINRVIAEIRSFKPSRERLGNEYAYQLSLHQWLKREFPSAKIERKRGHSRPDIVIGNIAIEVKGPTDSNALDTIASKCMRYEQYFPGGTIIVLFEVNVNEGYYKEWYTALKKKFPDTIVIRMS